MTHESGWVRGHEHYHPTAKPGPISMIHRITSRRGGLGACLLLTAMLGACATLDGVTTTLVAEKRVEHVIAGRGAPAVVFENGLGGSLDWWAKVLPEVSRYAMTFAYNRPGIGGSAGAATPRHNAG